MRSKVNKYIQNIKLFKFSDDKDESKRIVENEFTQNEIKEDMVKMLHKELYEYVFKKQYGATPIITKEYVTELLLRDDEDEDDEMEDLLDC